MFYGLLWKENLEFFYRSRTTMAVEIVFSCTWVDAHSSFRAQRLKNVGRSEVDHKLDSSVKIVLAQCSVQQYFWQGLITTIRLSASQIFLRIQPVCLLALDSLLKDDSRISYKGYKTISNNPWSSKYLWSRALKRLKHQHLDSIWFQQLRSQFHFHFLDINKEQARFKLNH